MLECPNKSHIYNTDTPASNKWVALLLLNVCGDIFLLVFKPFAYISIISFIKVLFLFGI